MANDNDEGIDSKNDDKDQDENLELTEKGTPADLEDEDDDSDAVKALKEKNRQLFARAKKAEGNTFDTTLKKWVKKAPKVKDEKKPDESDQSKKDEKKDDEKKPDARDLVNEELDNRELESLEMSDELKKEIKAYAKLHKVSIRSALKSDYIQFKKDKEDKDKKTDDASLGSNRRSSSSKKDYGDMKATDFDMSTEEGRKEFGKWRDHMRKELG